MFKVQNGIIHIVHFLQGLGFVEVCLTQRCRLEVLVLLFSHFSQLVEIFEGFFILLQLKIQEASLHQPLAHGLWIHFNDSGIGFDRIFDLIKAFVAVTLSKVTHSVQGRISQNSFEIAQCFIPFLLEDVDLASRNVCFQIRRILLNCFRESSDGAQIVIDSSICNRKHNEHRLPVVAAYFHQLFKISDGFLWKLLIKIGDSSVEERIIIGLVGYETLREHFGGILVLLLSQEELAGFKVFFTF